MKSIVAVLILSCAICLSSTIDAQVIYPDSVQVPVLLQDAQVHPDNVLVPVLFQEPISGALGSLWETEGFVYNDSNANIRLVYGITPTGLLHALVIPAKTTVKLDLYPPGFIWDTRIVPAYFLAAIEPERASDLHFYLRARDLSRQASTWGTEIPVVKLRDYAMEKIVLLNVPADDRFRRTLRLYTNTAKPAGDLLISFFGQTTGDLLGQQLVHVGEINPNTIGPYYAERHDDFFPRAAEPVRIVIEPMQSIDRFWGFVSVTNNETQHVTLITPQP